MRVLLLILLFCSSAYSQGIKIENNLKPEKLERNVFVEHNAGLIINLSSGVSGIYFSSFPFTKGDFSSKKYKIKKRRLGLYTTIQNGILFKKIVFDYTPEGSEWAGKVVIPFSSNPRYNFQKRVKKSNIYNVGINYSFLNRETFSLISIIGCGIYATETFIHYSDKALLPDWQYSDWEYSNNSNDYYFGDRPFVSEEKEIIFNQNFGLQVQIYLINFGVSYNTAPNSFNFHTGISFEL